MAVLMANAASMLRRWGRAERSSLPEFVAYGAKASQHLRMLFSVRQRRASKGSGESPTSSGDPNAFMVPIRLQEGPARTAVSAEIRTSRQPTPVFRRKAFFVVCDASGAREFAHRGAQAIVQPRRPL